LKDPLIILLDSPIQLIPAPIDHWPVNDKAVGIELSEEAIQNARGARYTLANNRSSSLTLAPEAPYATYMPTFHIVLDSKKPAVQLKCEWDIFAKYPEVQNPIQSAESQLDSDKKTADNAVTDARNKWQNASPKDKDLLKNKYLDFVKHQEELSNRLQAIDEVKKLHGKQIPFQVILKLENFDLVLAESALGDEPK